MKPNFDYVMAVSLGYATYIMITCPCEAPCGCKVDQFLIAAGIPLAYVFYGNVFSKKE